MATPRPSRAEVQEAIKGAFKRHIGLTMHDLLSFVVAAKKK